MQVTHTFDTELLVEMHDDLGVALSGEAMAFSSQLLAQLLEVVDLTVQDDHDRTVLTEDRLIAGHEINDPQALNP